jgi:hypothetical protein
MLMNLYRILTGPDDAAFCHRITEALNRGWQLYGSPGLTYDPARQCVICCQAIIKEVDGAYAPDLDLSRQ